MAYLLDHPITGRHSLFVDGKGFIGVSLTILVEYLPEVLNLLDELTVKIGSIQMYVGNDGSCEDLGIGVLKEF